ncbi:MAG TPA: DNA-formamidopyrimidine glycosylase family protein, partial [Pseudolysinimonas sp.]|nr:DNA-formamidopyrimidine glycosylase family protein [Pseudolysinimonas sp.]
MPELPEVEVVRSGLEPAVTGATVTHVEVLDSRSLRRHDGPDEDFIDRLTGARLLTPERRGKFLWIPLEPRGFVPFGGSAALQPPNGTNRGGEALVVHLGMSGQVLLRDPGAERDRLTRIVLDVDSP